MSDLKKMQLEVIRFSSEVDSTNGALFDISNGTRTFLCYTLEDEHRDEKVRGETRIPAGEYRITLRRIGRLHEKYSSRFPTIHKGMLWVRDVPNFEYILIHCGNTDEHTAGCLLLGDTQENNQIKKNGFVGHSTRAYFRVYPYILAALERGAEVTIKYTDFDTAY
jgi:hypothetical protein